jgi:superfamily II DNA or RNA helicase
MLQKTLRDDQALTIHNVREAIGDGDRRIVVQAPTGFGKGLLIADIIDRARNKDKNVLVTVPALSLVQQTVEVIYSQGIRGIGVIQGNNSMTDFSQPVQVASLATLANRWKTKEMPKADVVLIDEVHRWHVLFPQWLCDLKWQNIPFIGFSATPWTKGLGGYYNRLITGNDIDSLIAQGTLVPFRTFAPDTPDLTGCREAMGDFVGADLDEVMRPKKLVANIVETWKQLASDRPTICFCVSRAHADQIAKEFADAGIGAGYMDCNTKIDDWTDEDGDFHEGRKTVREKFLTGEYQIVCNVEIIGIGVDWPEISCIIYARPTMSDMRFVQNIGRGLRASPNTGKVDLLILDHSSTSQRLGFVNDVYSYHHELDDGKPKVERKVAVLLPKLCPACNYLKAPRVVKCPNCGHENISDAKPIGVERGTLREIKPGEDIADLRKQLPDKPHTFGQLVWWGRKKGYKQYWANMKFNEIYGVKFPRFEYEEFIEEPVPELKAYLAYATEQWVKQQNYAKRKAAQNARVNGHDHGALSDREQAAIDRVAEGVRNGSFMTEQDWKDFK